MGLIIALVMQMSAFTGINVDDYQKMTQKQQIEYIRDYNGEIND